MCTNTLSKERPSIQGFHLTVINYKTDIKCGFVNGRSAVRIKREATFNLLEKYVNYEKK